MIDTKTEQNTALIESQRLFLDEAVRALGKTLTEIARDARLNPSTLTRFRNTHAKPSLLSAPTLAAIAAVSGIAPPVPGTTINRPVRALRLRGLAESEGAPYDFSAPVSDLERAISTLIGPDLHRVPWKLNTRALENEGYRPGDIVILDLNRKPEAGDIVCAQIYNWQNHGATQTVFRVFEPPFLVASSPDAAHRKPHLVDNENVVIKGVVGPMFRP